MHQMGFRSRKPFRSAIEYVYCPRLAYMMWVQGEFAHNADTVEGAIRHKRMDQAAGKLPAQGQEGGVRNTV
jgi:CRISPR-associated protein Cas1